MDLKGRGLEKVGVGELSMKKVNPGGSESRSGAGYGQMHGSNQTGEISGTQGLEVTGNKGRQDMVKNQDRMHNILRTGLLSEVLLIKDPKKRIGHGFSSSYRHNSKRSKEIRRLSTETSSKLHIKA